MLLNDLCSNILFFLYLTIYQIRIFVTLQREMNWKKFNKYQVSYLQCVILSLSISNIISCRKYSYIDLITSYDYKLNIKLFLNSSIFRFHRNYFLNFVALSFLQKRNFK